MMITALFRSHPVCLLIFLLVCCAEARAGDLGSVTIQLKWKHQFQSAGFYAAIEQGYYRDAGLDVKLVEGGPTTDFTGELASGRAQYAVALPTMLIRRNAGEPVVALAAIFQHSPEVLLTLASSGINNPHQMAGKTVMMSGEDTPCVLAMFKNEGLPPESVKTVRYDFDLDRLTRREIDGIGAYITDEPLFFQHRNIPVQILQPRNYGVDLYGDCLFTTDRELAQNPARVRAFREASLRGWSYAMRHIDEMVQLTATKYRSEKSPADLRYEADRISELMFADLIEVGHMNEGRWRHIGDTYARLGMLRKDYSLGGFIYTPDAHRNLIWVWWVVAISIVSTLLLTGIILALARINRRIGRAEREASESRALLQTILDTIPVGVFWKDRSSVYLGCNRVFAQYAGLGSPEKIRGLRDRDLPWGGEADRFEVRDRKVLDTGLPELHYEEPLERSDTTVHLLKSKMPLRDGAGQVFGVLGVFEDITPLKESEARRSELAERVQQARTHESLYRLTAGVSHHFNNILQGVAGYAELASEELPANHSTSDHLRQIMEGTRRATALAQLLQVSLGHPLTGFKSLRIDDLVRGAAPKLQRILPSQQTLRVNCAAGDVRTLVESDTLNQLMAGLVSNASEATGDRTWEILLQTGRMPCDRAYLTEPYLDADLTEGEYVYVEVIDRGEGMTPDVLKSVFDPFFSTRLPGRGLGMASVLGIVRSHRGCIKINTLPGSGTTVRVLFPVHRESGAPV